jgi:hypothetical protein
MALSYKEKRPRIPFAKFNCDKHLNYCHSKNIPIFPYLVLYIKKHPIVFHGERNYKEILNFLESTLNRKPSTAKIENIASKAL